MMSAITTLSSYFPSESIQKIFKEMGTTKKIAVFAGLIILTIAGATLIRKTSRKEQAATVSSGEPPSSAPQSLLSHSASLRLSSALHPQQDVHFEKKYQHLICRPINLDAPIRHDYLSPNEANPQDMKGHFIKIPNAATGAGVTTGTERAVFYLLLGDFQCVISVDIEPKVKAYLDFLILLGRTSNDRNEFYSFATEAPLNKKSKDTIIQRIRSSNMPEHMKRYYLTNFEAFSQVFYSSSKNWIHNKDFSEVNYYMNEELFLKFKKYAEEGRFLSFCGDINDLASFDNVVAIDTSNIYFYTFIHPSLSPSSESPLMIWATPKPRWGRAPAAFDWNFYSYRHNAIDGPLSHEIKQLMNTFSEAHSKDTLRLVFIDALLEGRRRAVLAEDHPVYDFWLSKLSQEHPCESDIEDVGPPTSSSVPLHRFLNDYVQNNFYDASRFGLGIIDFGTTLEVNQKLRDATSEQLENIFRDPNVRRFLPQLIRLMVQNQRLVKNKMWYNVKYINGFEQEFKAYCDTCKADYKKDFNSYRKIFDFKFYLEYEGLLGDFPEMNIKIS